MRIGLALALCITLMGCTKTPPPPRGDEAPVPPVASDDRPWPRLKTLIAADHTPPETRPVDLESEADRALRAAFTQEGRFHSAVAEDAGACAVEVKTIYGLLVNGQLQATGDQGTARLVMEAEAHCPTRGESSGEVETYRVTVQREEAFSDAAGAAATRGLVAPASEQVASTIYGQVTMRHAADAAVVEALDPARPTGVIMEAASEAGERKLAAAVQRLVTLTQHSDEVVSLRAGAALGLIGRDDDGVISALARMTEGPDPERHLIAVHAMGDIGGARAVRYLDALAVGHPEAGIREAARQAMKRAKRTERNTDSEEGAVHDAPP